jgi:hypothetical protein
LGKNPNIVMAWMTQHIQRVLDAWHDAGTRRVEGDHLRHMALVHVQRINLRGVLQLLVARYRNRLILETPSRARQRANAATGKHIRRRKPLMLMSNLT